jgi:hypothetical protein
LECVFDLNPVPDQGDDDLRKVEVKVVHLLVGADHRLQAVVQLPALKKFFTFR